MLRRIGLRRTFLLAALVLGSAACDDESPTLSGDGFFPGGSAPVTREVIIPAGSAFRQLGVFTGYTGPRNVGYYVSANRYGGELNANALFRTAGAFPSTLTYTQDNVNRSDTTYRLVGGAIVVRLDSATSSAGAVTVQVFRATQSWDAATATWDFASDTSGVQTRWTTPGGTKGALLGSNVYNAVNAGDSLVIPMDSAQIASLRDTTSFGFILSVAGAGQRVRISELPSLRVSVRPATPVRDTVIETTLSLSSQPSTFVFTPEPPQPAGALAVGGIRSARTLFRLVFPDSVTGCDPAGGACARVALRDVRLNQVSLLLRRVPVSAAFSPLDSSVVSVYSVTEPELGRRAPLGAPVLNPNVLVLSASQGFTSAQPGAIFAPADSVLELNFTNFATTAAAGDTVPTSFALLGGPQPGIPVFREYDTFSLAAFAPEPRLRIVYTLPVRGQLP